MKQKVIISPTSFNLTLPILKMYMGGIRGLNFLLKINPQDIVLHNHAKEIMAELKNFQIDFDERLPEHSWLLIGKDGYVFSRGDATANRMESYEFELEYDIRGT